MSYVPRFPEHIPVGNAILRQWDDLEIQQVVREIQEISPNLVLCKNEDGHVLVLEATRHGEWRIFCHMANPTKMDLLRLPALIRSRDQEAPENKGRNLILETIDQQERQMAELRQQKIDAQDETWDRLHHALRKDLGEIRRIL